MANVANSTSERPRVRRTQRAALPERERPSNVGGRLFFVGAAATLGWASRAIARRRRAGARPALRRLGRTLGEAGGALGRGLLAGMFGTLSITTVSAGDKLATEIAQARRDQRAPHLDVGDAIVSPWAFSADVVGKVLGITANDAEHKRRLSVMAHWGYGSTWGVGLAALRALGVRGVAAMGSLLAAQLSAEMYVMPAFGLFPAASKWGRRAVVSSVYQHAIYAAAAVASLEWLRGGTRRHARRWPRVE